MKKLGKYYYDIETKVKERPMKYLVGLLILAIIAIAI